MSNCVRIYYGPSEEFYNLMYKPQKLRGIKDELVRRGYCVDIIPVNIENCCRLNIAGHEVFRCNIQQLAFNTPHALDPVCQRAVDAVKNASEMLQRANTYFWLEYLIEELIFKRSEFAPKHVWPFDVEMTL